ncbi:hypothetical protein KSS87_015550 [Heliosperma pusillum]|nr:hypothetical protein KSS87_015550 [Heliosperma pusillum]
MSQVDNRNPSTAKRARTDGGRREDDWTCPGCGNVNFSFRTTCNMRNCTQPRPADHNGKSAVKPMQAPQPYASSGPYGGGSGAPPSSMYLGMPPYGSSMFNGSSVPPYDVPFSGGSAYPYNYPNRMSGGSPYRPMPGPPPPYSGGMYGMPPPMMDRYGMSMQHMAPPPMGPRPGFFSDSNSQKKDMPRDNDWICPKCGNVNFSFRITCNMRKCGTPKPGLQVPKPEKNPKGKMPDGSWKCEKCGNSNFPFRNKCNRQNCGAEKPAEENKSPSPEADETEQYCMNPHTIDLQFSTVPVSSRTCLVVWKVQSCRPACSVSMSESQSCRRRIAAVTLPSR